MRDEILVHLKTVDPGLEVFLDKYPDIKDLVEHKPEKYFEHLMRHIVYQQISGKAGDAIWKRLIHLTGSVPNPEILIEIEFERLREAGLSNSKANYVLNIANAFIDKSIVPKDLNQKSDEEVIEILTQIKGIGRWTAEMFLMFTLGREDIFSLGDLGLKKGFAKVKNMKKDPSPKYLTRMTKKWSPYRSYASLLLWRSLDNR